MNQESAVQKQLGATALRPVKTTQQTAHSGRRTHKTGMLLLCMLAIGASFAAVVSLPLGTFSLATSGSAPLQPSQSSPQSAARPQGALGVWAVAKRLAQVLGISNPTAAATDSNTVQLVYSFPAPQGYDPQAGVVLGSDGNLYGTTTLGGDSGHGTIFSMTLQGAITVLHSFSGTDGIMPLELIEATPGTFYGVTTSGGASNAGTIFKITSAGDFSTLYSFDSAAAAGSAPLVRLTLGTDGDLYGTTSQGGASTVGTFFKISTAGELTVLAALDNSTFGSAPSSLVQAPDGNFYGVTSAPGSLGSSIIFRATPAGVITAISTYGCAPNGGLVLGSDGNLYGISTSSCDTTGISNVSGSFFMVTTAGAVTTLAGLSTGNDAVTITYNSLVQGANGQFYVMSESDQGPVALGPNLCLFSLTPTQLGGLTQQSCPAVTFGAPTRSPLVAGADGTVYGTSRAFAQGAGAVYAAIPGGTTGAVASFDISNGATPGPALVQGPDGSFYGATAAGGGANFGTLFRIGTDGTLQTLASFTAATGITASGLVLASDGTLLGNLEGDGPAGGGAIFRLAPGASALTGLYSFTSGSSDANPRGPLTLDAQGNLYGTTSDFDAFKLAPDGTIAFYPAEAFGLTLGSDGNLYGASDQGFEAFQLTPQGTIQDFAAIPRPPAPASNGSPAQAGLGTLLQGVDGRFYGLSSSGALTGANTIVYAVSSDGTAQSIANLSGFEPNSTLVQAPDGTLYGTIAESGPSDDPTGATPTSSPNGTVFSVSPSGQVQTVFTFDGAHGSEPSGGLILGKDGALYGTATKGGAYGLGAVFRIAIATAPPVPANVSATAADGSVTLSWSPSTGATSYNVYQGSTAGGEAQTPVLTGVTASTATITGLTDGTPYYFKIAAVGASGTSAQSGEASATPVAKPSGGGTSSSSSSPSSSSSSSPPASSNPPSSGGGGAVGLDMLAVLLGAIVLRGFNAARRESCGN